MNSLSVLKHNLASLYGLFRLARDPDATRYVFMIGDAQDSLAEEAFKRGEIRNPFHDAALEELWQKRYFPPRYDQDELLNLDSSSLGGVYARHLKEHGLRLDFHDGAKPRNKMHYVRLRIRQTHDIWHTLTGYGTDLVGEVGLQGFYFAQFTNGQSALIAAGAILKCVLSQRYGELEKFVHAFCEGFENGRHAQPMLGVKWELLWQEPVTVLRRRFDITPAR
ncbi:MAG: Coq4 family protein [Burkholderiales bacterium]